ncbi:MobA protein [Agromyces binzhouensis]|uniref:MobA protein n=1 Tax=Agromyces binzhouensis TaxID=1817495 RepID=A0A4Q2J7T8_9MICO|nr:MobA protein [Agromyces binzhouensis]RXZ40577.1 MobA protein [Agromyces binzhouensis]
MPAPADPDASVADFSSLFDRGLVQWGLRGDPHLWSAMRDSLAGAPMPEGFWDVRSTVGREFARLTGQPLTDTDEPLRVAAFVTGSGMSDGHVLPSFWVRTAIPILIDRWAAVRSSRATTTA